MIVTGVRVWGNLVLASGRGRQDQPHSKAHWKAFEMIVSGTNDSDCWGDTLGLDVSLTYPRLSVSRSSDGDDLRLIFSDCGISLLHDSDVLTFSDERAQLGKAHIAIINAKDQNAPEKSEFSSLIERKIETGDMGRKYI